MTRATGRLQDAYEILQRSERYILCRSKAANPRHTYATLKLDAQGHAYDIRVHSTLRQRSTNTGSCAFHSFEHNSRNGPVGRLPGMAARH